MKQREGLEEGKTPCRLTVLSVIYSENAARLKWDLIGWMVLIGGLLPPDHWTLCLCVSGAPENKTGSDRYERKGRRGKGRRRSTAEKRSTRRGPGGDDSREEGFIVEQASKGGGRERGPLCEELGVVITVCFDYATRGWGGGDHCAVCFVSHGDAEEEEV